jgi:riboflavin synthase
MFSGIVKGIGELLEQTSLGQDRRLKIGHRDVALEGLATGASIAVSGVCLTAVEHGPGWFAADVSAETARLTTLGRLNPGARVNLEPSLRLGDSLDGHLVTGHIDGVGTVLRTAVDGRSTRVTIEVPEALSRYVARKGSIAVDGVSLTVNVVDGARLEVNVIPHTLQVTIIGEYRPGRAVNIEVDIIARYLERLGRAESESGVTLELLKKHGYARND